MLRAMDVVFSREGFRELATRLRALGSRRVLVISGPTRRHVDAATAALAELDPVVFDGAKVHVPLEVVARAREAAANVDTIVAIGGGSTIGLGKALRLERDVRFAVVPTTYAGSEQTSMYGITRERDKQTGRDPRVLPDLVIYDATLARDMPIALTVQSLCNSLAHVASVASTGHTGELGAARDALHAIEDLLLAPRALAARERAARAAAACAVAFEHGKPGVQHALAHLLGGALGLDHAALHALLLPHFLAHLRHAAPDTLARLEDAVDRSDLDAYVHDLLVRAGAPVALTALGTTAAAVEGVLRPDLPAAIARDAIYGLRPPGRGGRITLGGSEALVIGPPPAQARRIVLALHGRGAEAGTIARRYREIAGHDPEVCILGLRTDGDRWYAVRYGEPGAGSDAEVTRALDRVDAALAALPRERTILAGFSQGACLALEYAARRGAGLAGVIAPCGARIGQRPEWSDARLDGLPVLVGAATDDKWIAQHDLHATAAWFRDAGATVDVVGGPGDRHEITARQRLRARELILSPPPVGPSGFGNTLSSEAIAGAIPPHQNSPRRPPFGLYAEQLSGTGFTAARADNRRTWCYRVRPASQRTDFAPLAHPRLAGEFPGAPVVELTGFPPLAGAPEHDFLDGLVTLCGAGDARLRTGYALHRYAATRSMESRAFYSADGDLLILPERGAFTLLTELGALAVAPGSLAIVPRGLAFSILLHDEPIRGYVAEPFGGGFRLPERGPVGANGLADARHFHAPAAWHEDRLAPGFTLVAKLGGALHAAPLDHTPFDVAGWFGNHVPYVYDLADFSPVGNTLLDHGDPSIYCVLSAPNLDLIVFPPRWDATAHTFRPPYFHRNTIAEINGILRDDEHHAPFVPGCVFITPPLTPHGVGGRTVERERARDDDAPYRVHDSLWFQLESPLAPVLAAWAHPVEDWSATWPSARSYFER